MEKRKVLIVDRDKGLVEALSMLLGAAGSFSIETAFDAGSGVSKARSFAPEVILTDLLPSSRCAGELRAGLSAGEGVPPVPVISLSEKGLVRPERAPVLLRGRRLMWDHVDWEGLLKLLEFRLPATYSSSAPLLTGRSRPKAAA